MGDLRISGLASGMDTDLMVQSLMKVERLKVSKIEQSKQISLWRQEAYSNMNKMFANFILNTKKDMGLTKTTSTGMSLQNAYSNLSYVRKATSSDETKATVSATSKAVNGNFSFEVKSLAEGATLNSSKVSKDDTFGTEMKIKLTDGGEEITINNASGITMKDIANAINKSDQGISASFNVDSYGNGVLNLSTKAMGKDAKIALNVVEGGGDFLTKFAESTAEGKDAKVEFNGATLEYNSNNISINDVDISLKDIGKVNVNVATNVEGIMEKIEKLVNDYNDLLDKASKILDEKKYPSYHPLSDEERNAMKENDLKLWDEKAKSGLLSKDDTITRVLQNARNEIYKTLENAGGAFKHITEIGITTEKYSKGSAGGKLEIDKDKLRAAIEKDPDGVMELLFKEDDTQATDSSKSNKGVFTRVYDSIIDGMKSIIDKSGPGDDKDLLRNVRSNILLDFVTKKSSISDLDKEVFDANKRIDNLNALLYKKETAYYQKFANMEKMLQQMNNQSSWIGQQLMR